MVAWTTLLALLSTSVAASSAKDAKEYVCGKNHQKDNIQWAASNGNAWNYGQDTNPLEHPWLVQLVYAGKKRECAGTLITDRHVLTARQCVKGVKPKDISVIYGPRTPYGGNVSVKSAKSPREANADLAVLELSFGVEISENTIPVCVADTYDYSEYKGLHYGSKNKSQDSELARSMYQDVLFGADEKECIDALGKDYHKDTQFCVSKRNMVYADPGGPTCSKGLQRA
ncbi:oviductin [Aphelenchoides avenae]|nr:oviductin [Aphelenchus avenae]